MSPVITAEKTPKITIVHPLLLHGKVASRGRRGSSKSAMLKTSTISMAKAFQKIKEGSATMHRHSQEKKSGNFERIVDVRAEGNR